MIIGIDGSTTASGYAFGDQQIAGPRGGVWKTPGCSEMGGVFDVTLGNLGRSIMELARLVKPKAIYIEAPMSKIDREHSEATAMALVQLAGGMRMACAMVQARVELCSVYNVRHYFIGTGYLKRADAKAKVMARCRELGWSFADDNEADAKAVWAYGMSREYAGWKPNEPQLFDQVRATP